MIVILTQCFPPEAGGIQALMGGLADGLHGLGRRVVVLADGHGGGDEAALDASLAYEIERFSGLKQLRRRRKIAALTERLRQGSVDAIFSDSWKSAEHCVAAIQQAGVPLICLAHGNDVLARGRDGRSRRIRKTLSAAHRIAANSADTARRIRHLAIDPAHIRVVNPGAVPPAEPAPKDLERMAGIVGDGRPLLLTVARLEPRKGHDPVLRCLPRLIAEHPGLSYAIAGEGAYRDHLEVLVRDLGLGGHVNFFGRVWEADKAALYAMADLFVMPTREDTTNHSVEGFGIAYIEAAFAGVPAVAGQGGGVADAVIDGDTGVLCDGADPADVERAIAACLDDPERMSRMGDAARRRATATFTWSAAAARYLACLENGGTAWRCDAVAD